MLRRLSHLVGGKVGGKGGKAYTMIEINLLPFDLRPKGSSARLNYSARYFKYIIPVFLGVLMLLHICLLIAVIAKESQLRILNRKWVSYEPKRKALDDFNREYAALSEDALTIQNLISGRINFALKLNELALNLPSGIWFNAVSLSQKDFIINGSAISLEKQELVIINKFLDSLKNNPDFLRDFEAIELNSVQAKQIGGYDIADFVISAKLRPKL